MQHTSVLVIGGSSPSAGIVECETERGYWLPDVEVETTSPRPPGGARTLDATVLLAPREIVTYRLLFSVAGAVRSPATQLPSSCSACSDFEPGSTV
jgi:hypothetical protein